MLALRGLHRSDAPAASARELLDYCLRGGPMQLVRSGAALTSTGVGASRVGAREQQQQQRRRVSPLTVALKWVFI